MVQRPTKELLETAELLEVMVQRPTKELLEVEYLLEVIAQRSTKNQPPQAGPRVMLVERNPEVVAEESWDHRKAYTPDPCRAY